MATAYIALGSNLDPRMVNLANALEAIAHLPETHLEDASSAYESEPAYVEDQPRFLNAVVKVTTTLTPDALLAHLMDVEAALGRVRTDENGPRVIDLDLLLYDDEERVSETLTLPHPRLLERDFVVTPLLEIAPDIVLPDGTRPRRDAAPVGRVIRDAGPIPDVDHLHDVPVEPAEWVVVAASEDVTDRISGFDAALQFARQVLAAEGIPVAWDPYEPGVETDPFGMMVPFKLLVPAADEQRAREALAAAAQAEPRMPDEEAPSDVCDPESTEPDADVWADAEDEWVEGAPPA